MELLLFFLALVLVVFFYLAFVLLKSLIKAIVFGIVFFLLFLVVIGFFAYQEVTTLLSNPTFVIVHENQNPLLAFYTPGGFNNFVLVETDLGSFSQQYQAFNSSNQPLSGSSAVTTILIDYTWVKTQYPTIKLDEPQNAFVRLQEQQFFSFPAFFLAIRSGSIVIRPKPLVLGLFIDLLS